MRLRRELVASGGLLRRVLPLVLLAGAAKLGAYELGWDTLEVNPLFSGLVTATVFILGFLLAGTLVDYKESERMPGDIVAGMSTIADECLTLHELKQEPAATQCAKGLQDLARDLNDWMRGKHRIERVLRSVEMLNHHFAQLEPVMQATFLNRMKLAQAEIRKLVLRIEMIRDTSFVMAGYAVAQLVSLLLVGGIVFLHISQLGLAIFLVCMITFFLSYMIFLIGDLDDPFDFSGAGPADAEVSLKALDQFEDRLAASVGRLDPKRHKAPAGAVAAT